MIPYARQSLNQADKDAVLRVLDSDRLTQGPEVDAFEEEFAKKVEAPYAVAFSSGTAALHAACYAANSQNTFVTSALTFVASANAALYVGGRVEFTDIDPETWNMSARLLAETILRQKSSNWPDVVIPVHFAGLPAPMAEISHACSDIQPVIIEDACHALGARTEGGPVGNCAHSDFTCFSFHPAKAITAAEGGMVTCRTKANVKALKRFRNHGFDLSGGWYRDQVELGYNYRMSDLHAALGRSQLKRLDDFITRRHEVAGRYLEELSGVVALPPYSPHHAWHLFVIRHPARNAIYKALKERGIETQVHYMPLYRNTFHRGPDFRDFPNTEAYFSECLSLPIYPSLKNEDQTKVIEAIRDVV